MSSLSTMQICVILTIFLSLKSLKKEYKVWKEDVNSLIYKEGRMEERKGKLKKEEKCANLSTLVTSHGCKLPAIFEVYIFFLLYFISIIVLHVTSTIF